jgi:hypothetical protein
MPEIGVVHLVRAKNGVGPFKRFLDSYAKNPGGIEHELLIIYKGFSGQDGVSEYERLLRDQPHQSIFVKDAGFDIKPYFIAANSVNYKYLCFLNSFSVIQDEKWLLKMYRAISKDGVGLVGATGSYQSIFSDSVAWVRRKKIRPFYKRMLLKVFRRYIVMMYKQLFFPFPNYHIRTNAFMISRELMCRLNCNRIFTKIGAYKFESGKNNMTKQIMMTGLKAVVVGKDGRAYEKDDWHRSDTFWQRDQHNLLIADNQTTIFLTLPNEEKAVLSRYAWGDKAEPY